MNTITLVVGDWSHDGHNMTQNFIIRCNLTVKELDKAYKAGVKKVKVDLTEDVARDYEDYVLSKADAQKFAKTGFEFTEKLFEPSEDEDGAYNIVFGCESFGALWLHIAKVGNPKLKWQEADEERATINIGGYGLFTP